MFFTRYSQNKFKSNRIRGGKEAVEQYTIDEDAKCICFCQQRLGRQAKCEHAYTDDVDMIS